MERRVADAFSAARQQRLLGIDRTRALQPRAVTGAYAPRLVTLLAIGPAVS